MDMNAIVLKEYGDPSVMEWGMTEKPEVKAGEVLIKVLAAGVNRADLLQRRGYYPPPRGASEILGLEVSGTIVEIGEGAETDLAIGDTVVALLEGGGYAEYVAVPAGQVIPVPAGVDPVDAAGLIEVAATVVSNMDHVHLSEGETLLVHGGTGGIGAFAIQYAKTRGCRVFTTAGSADKVQQCLDLGADKAFDYHDDWVAGVKDASDGRGVDVILDIMGAKYLPLNVDSLARGGRLVVIGLQGGRKGELDLNKVLTKQAWVTATSLRFRPKSEKAEICTRVASEVWPAIVRGDIKLPKITRFAIADAPKAHEFLDSESRGGKVILTI